MYHHVSIFFFLRTVQADRGTHRSMFVVCLYHGKSSPFQEFPTTKYTHDGREQRAVLTWFADGRPGACASIFTDLIEYSSGKDPQRGRGVVGSGRLAVSSWFGFLLNFLYLYCNYKLSYTVPVYYVVSSRLTRMNGRGVRKMGMGR